MIFSNLGDDTALKRRCNVKSYAGIAKFMTLFDPPGALSFAEEP